MKLTASRLVNTSNVTYAELFRAAAFWRRGIMEETHGPGTGP